MKGKPRVTVVRDTVYKAKVETKTVYKTRIERDTVYIERKDTYEDFFYKGMDFLLRGENTKAITSFTRSIEMKNDFPAAYNNLGLAYAELEESQSAITAFKKAIVLDRSVIYQKNLSKAYFNSEDYKSALNQALNIPISDRDDEVLNLLAKAAFNLQKFEEAKKYFELIDKEKGDHNTYLYLGLLSGMTGDSDKARDYFEKSIELKPTAQAYFNRGLSLFNSLSLDLAIKDIDKAISLDRNYANAYLLKGNIYFKQNKMIEACENWSKASELGNKQAKTLGDKYCLAFNLLKEQDDTDY